MRLNLAIVVGLMCVAVLVSAGSAGGAWRDLWGARLPVRPVMTR